MEKLGSKIKQLTKKSIEKNLEESQGVFFIRYSGINGLDMNILRKGLKEAKGKLFVAKNSIARKLFEELGKNEAQKFVEGPIGFIYIKEDPVSISKILVDFIKDHEKLVIEGGLLQDKILDKNAIVKLSKLPSREVLIAQVVGGFKSPINNLVFVLSGILKKPVFAIQQIKKSKERS
jgi:large subunit ribosomal protein L10